MALASALLASALGTLAHERGDQAAIVSARALAEVAGRLWDRQDRLRSAVAEHTYYTDERARVVSVVDSAAAPASALVASTFPDDGVRGTQPRPAPRPLGADEKSLFDRGRRLQANAASNGEEGAVLRPVVEVQRLLDGGVRATAPVAASAAGSAPEVVAIVEIEAPPRPAGGGVPLPAALLALAAPLAIVAAAARVLARRWALVAVAAVAVAAALAWLGQRAGDRVAIEVGRAQQGIAADVDRAAARATALLGDVPAAGLDRASWSCDRYGRPLPVADEAAAQLLARRLGVDRDGLRGSLLLVGALALAALLLVALGVASRVGAALLEHRQAYLYILPAVAGTLVLVFFPFFYGITLSFTDQNIFNTSRPLTEIWVGLRNYVDILSDVSVMRRTADGGLAVNYLNFYYTLLFTIVWTITNVTWGVVMGLLVALALNQRIAARPVYRMLLIFPWATPNYITALTWKGMFHQQFGVVNQVVRLLGGTPVAWFDRPLSAFFTVWATNGWLSIPFNMVVSLGALQSIPADLYEAARVDGASRWQQFRAITLPMLRPALVPAVILGVVWTFNMFNVIFLVTAGEPESSTEILITQAYKYAFERYRYGYAAAYSTVIFLILLLYGAFQNRVSRGTESD